MFSTFFSCVSLSCVRPKSSFLSSYIKKRCSFGQEKPLNFVIKKMSKYLLTKYIISDSNYATHAWALIRDHECFRAARIVWGSWSQNKDVSWWFKGYFNRSELLRVLVAGFLEQVQLSKKFIKDGWKPVSRTFHEGGCLVCRMCKDKPYKKRKETALIYGGIFMSTINVGVGSSNYCGVKILTT